MKVAYSLTLLSTQRKPFGTIAAGVALVADQERVYVPTPRDGVIDKVKRLDGITTFSTRRRPAKHPTSIHPHPRSSLASEAASFSPYPQSRFPPSCIFMYIHVFGVVYMKYMNNYTRTGKT